MSYLRRNFISTSDSDSEEEFENLQEGLENVKTTKPSPGKDSIETGRSVHFEETVKSHSLEEIKADAVSTSFDSLQVQKPPSAVMQSPSLTSYEWMKCEKWKENTFIIREMVFQGDYSKIYKVIHKITKELAYLQISRKNYQYKTKYLSEEYIWRLASSHPYIVELYSAHIFEDRKYFFFEYFPLIDLRSFVKIHKVLQTEVATLLTAQIASAVEFLHNNDIFHRDVSSRQILLDNEGKAKLSNFRHALINKTALGVHRNLYYQAPEVFSGEIYDRSADWYSLGVCLYEMVMGMTPVEYHCKRNQIRFKELDYTGKIVVMLTSKAYIPEIFSKNLKEILQGLLQESNEHRLGYKENSEVLAHPFFETVNKEELEGGLLKAALPNRRNIFKQTLFHSKMS